MDYVERLQGVLDFEGWANHPQFASRSGLGRTGLAGFLLGVCFGVSTTVLCLSCVVTLPYGDVLFQWSLYTSALSGFHFSEFLVTALYKPTAVSYDSFVINHSPAYTVAALASWVEFWVETVFLKRDTKFQPVMFGTGMFLVGVGQFFRGAAMWTCASNFNHVIMERREEGHELVQHGIYGYFRHPSYFGWFWWSVGTQCLLCNPICTVAYAVASWDFFQKRIPYEEATLMRFYPGEYPAYMMRTHIGIPFVVGAPIPASAIPTQKED